MRSFHSIQPDKITLKSGKEVDAKWFFHFRNLSSFPYSGATVCLMLHNGDLFSGISLCGEKDQFCRKIGRSISEGRVKKSIEYGDVVMNTPVNGTEKYEDLAKLAETLLVEFIDYIDAERTWNLLGWR